MGRSGHDSASCQFTVFLLIDEIQPKALPALLPIGLHSLTRPLSHGGFQSTRISVISSILDRLGLSLDQELLLGRRRQLLAILPRHRMQGAPVSLPTTFSLQLELSRLIPEVESELDKPVDTQWIGVIAFSRCEGFAPFLDPWSQTLEADYVVSDMAAKFERERSPRNRLALLLVGYIIHRHLFGTGEAMKEAPHIPYHLSRRGLDTFEEAVKSYARNFQLESVLQSLMPSMRLKFDRSQGRLQQWKDFWNQNYPGNWELHTKSSALSRPESLQTVPSTWDMADLRADDGQRSLGDTIPRFFTGCFTKPS